MQNLLEHCEQSIGNLPALGPQIPVASLPALFNGPSILDILNEGVLIVDTKPSIPEITFANNACDLLLGCDQSQLSGQPLKSVLPHSIVETVTKMAREVSLTGKSMTTEVDYHFGETGRVLQFKVLPSEAIQPPLSSKCGVICLINDQSRFTDRSNYLEKRAIKMVDHANELESSRRSLEKKVAHLQRKIDRLEKVARYDPVTGLAKRAHFLEQAAAEFQRSKRYGSEMSVVVVEAVGYDDIVEKYGAKVGNRVLTGFAQICESGFRQGVDFAGRTGPEDFTIVLPETNLTGALQYVDRLRQLVAGTPLHVEDTLIHMGVKTGVDMVQTDDENFKQSLARITASM